MSFSSLRIEVQAVQNKLPQRDSMQGNVGGIGEKLLGIWADEIDVVANRSQDRDATGWDYILEWKVGHTANTNEIRIPLDRSPSSLKCFVQVKSTNLSTRKISVKLSNWYYLVRNPYPAFFLVLCFANRKKCQAAYLVHIGPDQIASVLKRIRELEVDSPDFRLNKKKMTLTWGEDHGLKTLDGEGLELAIKSHVTADMDQYVQRKQHLNQTVGHDGPPLSMTLKLKLPANVDPEDHVIDFDLGIVHHLEISSGVVYDQRFGTKLPTSSLPAGGLLQIVQNEPQGQGLIEITNITKSKTCRNNCQVFLPKSFGRHREFKLDVHLPAPDEVVSLRALHDAAKLMRLMYDAIKDQDAVRLIATFQDFKRTGSIQANNPPSPLLGEWAQLVHYAWTVARHFELDEELHLSSREIIYRKGALQTLFGFLGPGRGSFRVNFWVSDSEPMDEKRCCIPLVAMTQLGNKFFAIGAAIIGEMRFIEINNLGDRQYQVTTRDVRIICDSTDFDAKSAPIKDMEMKGIITRMFSDMQIIEVDT